MTIAEAVNWGAAMLCASEKCTSIAHDREQGAREARWLLGFCAGLSNAEVCTRSEQVLTDETELTYRAAVVRRAAGEPFAYITGKREFFGYEFVVTPAVLIPRPETEFVVEEILKRIGASTTAFRLIDVGVGSGAILLSTLSELRRKFGEQFLQRGTAVGIDISADALSVARTNARYLELDSTVEFLEEDLLPPRLSEFDESAVNIIAANLPYVCKDERLSPEVVEHEPHLALFAGADGLDQIRKLLAKCAALPATIILEFGKGQEDEVESLARSLGRENIQFVRDFQGIIRVAVVERGNGRTA